MMSEYNDEYVLDERAKEKLLNALSKLGIKSAEKAMFGGLSASDFASLAQQAAANFGVPDKLYINPHTLAALKRNIK